MSNRNEKPITKTRNMPRGDTGTIQTADKDSQVDI